MDELSGLVQGHVSVGMVTSCSFVGLFDQLAEFHNVNPGIDITLSEDTSDRLVHAVLNGQLDLALVGIAGATPAGIESFVIADEPIVAAVALGDPLVSREKVTLPMLAKRPLVCLPHGTGIRKAFDDASARLAGCTRTSPSRRARPTSSPDLRSEAWGSRS